MGLPNQNGPVQFAVQGEELKVEEESRFSVLSCNILTTD